MSVNAASEHNKVDDALKDLDKRTTILDVSISYITKQVDSIYLSDTKLYRDIRVFFGAMATVAVLGGAISYSINSSQIKDAATEANNKIEKAISTQSDLNNNNIAIIKEDFKRLSAAQALSLEDIKEKADDFVKGYTIDSAVLTSAGDDQDYVVGQSTINKVIVSGILPRYENIISFAFNIKGVRDDNKFGTAKMIGVFLRIDGPFVHEIALAPSGENEVSLRKFTIGELNQVEINTFAGYPSYFTIQESIIRRSCEDIAKAMKALNQKSDAGNIYLTPIFDRITTQPTEKRFKIKMGKPVGLYSCKEL